jgi:hypothetical protein
MIETVLSNELFFISTILIVGIVVGMIIVKIQFKKIQPQTAVTEEKNEKITHPFTYTITPIKKEYLRYDMSVGRRLYLPTRSVPLAIFKLIALIIITIVLVFLFLKNNDEYLIFILLIATYAFYDTIKKLLKFLSFENEPKEYIIDDEGITVIENNTKIIFAWNDLSNFSYKEDLDDPDHLFYVYMKDPTFLQWNTLRNTMMQNDKEQLRVCKIIRTGFVIYHKKEDHEEILSLLNNKLPYILYL